jgi:hypothetical protein
MEPWRRSDLYARPSPPRACDPIELDRTIATLLLRVDLLTVTSTDDRPDAINLPSLCRPAAEDATGHHDATARQPIRVGEFTQSPRILIVDDGPAMRAALRGLLEDADLPVIGEASDGLPSHQPGRRARAGCGGDGPTDAGPGWPTGDQAHN